MVPDQGDSVHNFSGPVGTTSTCPFKISDFPFLFEFHWPITFILESGENPSSLNAGWSLISSNFTGIVSD